MTSDGVGAPSSNNNRKMPCPQQQESAVQKSRSRSSVGSYHHSQTLSISPHNFKVCCVRNWNVSTRQTSKGLTELQDTLRPG